MIRTVTLDKTTYADPPAKFEAGTPPITQAVGLGVAIDWMSTIDHAAATAHLGALTERVLAGLADLSGGNDRIGIVGPTRLHERFPVVSFSVEGAHPHDICQMLDARGVALRGGHHCAQPFMESCGLAGTTRASLAIYNDDSDVDAFLNGLEDTLARLIS
jgi:cysteine desulfurase/selenocysteine lyase